MKKNEIICINTSTNLPVDFKIKEKLNAVINPLLIINEENQLNQITIFFVNEQELDSSITKEECITENELNIYNPDLLGICIYKSPELNGQTLIKVSPEKILKCAYKFKEKEKLKESHLEIYKILLIKVVLHELGHYFLSEDSYQDFSSAKWICDGLDEAKDDNYYLNTISNSNNNYPVRSWIRYFSWYKIIEESLANRYVLEHNWGKEEQKIIWKFITNQPLEYKAAISWKNTNDIQRVFKSWKNIKNDNQIEKYLNEYDKNHTIFKEIIEKLIDNKNIKDCDFYKFFIDHIEETVNSKNLVINKDILNGTFGIYWTLSNYYSEINPKKALQYYEKRLSTEQGDDTYADIYRDIAYMYKSNNKEYKKYLALALSHSEKTNGYHENARTKFLQEELNKLN